MLKKKIMLPVIYGLAYLFTLYIVIQYIIYKPSQAGVVSSKLEDPNFPYAIWKLFFFPHIILGILALLIGAYQLTNRSRLNRKRHRLLGRIYGFAILINVLLVPYLAMYATGGIPSTIAFLVLDIFWLMTTMIAIIYIRRKNITRHREWMLRSYAVTFVFVTFRIFLLMIQFSTHASFSVAFSLAVYLAIIINMLITQVYLNKRTRGSSVKKLLNH
ncbi:DUF2306 domain-containing protein [Neobacillus cucumis]|uniref:DUF2306 domain-containing protein n=1 Tax=Neobacillus cucumis TaxID=1740721 RepID=UPI0019655173|nr:DUF2306 domain-containing protein [Neobacillus cucumis]MBM7652810.1 uncharacterized membrane protein YozB (DUF420 family) [Neobacillus cucumis]